MRCGILGDGQLSQMLALAAHGMGIFPIILGRRESPAGLVSAHIMEGSVDRVEDLKKFFEKIDIAAFESEFIRYELLNECPGAFEKMVPNGEAVRTAQNKLAQKILFEKLALPTAVYLGVTEQDLADAEKKLGLPFILKLSKLGYDGKGVFKVNKIDESAKIFVAAAEKRSIRVYAEKYIEFTGEVSLVCTRARSGAISFYPLVLSNQIENVCELAYGPAASFGCAANVEKKAQEIAQSIANALSLVGTFAVEFFLTPRSDLLINELAPRVHNTGHFSQNASQTSQFENHWRALLDWPLGSTESAPFFAMINLLGPKEKTTKSSNPPKNLPGKLHLHWYGKSECRPLRKMGHINAWSPRLSDSTDLLDLLKKARSTWQKSL